MAKFKHMGIFVHDIDKMAGFYKRLAGLTETDRGFLDIPDDPEGRQQEIVFLSNDPEEHHEFILVSGRPADIAFNPINQISFRVETLAELREVKQKLETEDVSEIRPITHGNAWSVYVRDPEGNRLEFYLSSPFYTLQPFREFLDLTLSDEEIIEDTRSRCEDLPGFKLKDEWIKDMRRRMELSKES